jgi:hypothetical protein
VFASKVPDHRGLALAGDLTQWVTVPGWKGLAMLSTQSLTTGVATCGLSRPTKLRETSLRS